MLDLPSCVNLCAASQGRVALDKSEGVVEDTRLQSGVGASQRVPEKVEDQDSGNLTLNHSAVDLRSTNHRFGLTRNHDSSMRTSRLYGMRERPINPAV